MGIGFLVCIVNLLITLVAHVLMRLGCQQRILVGSGFFQTWKLSS